MRKSLSAVLLFASLQAWASAPTITSVSPATLGTAGGTITVTGTDFASDATVKVGAYPCADITVTSATELTCTAPENIARKADLSLLNADGGTATLTAGLTYTGTPGFALLQDRVFSRFGVNAQGITVAYHCAGCHGGSKPAAGLDTTVYADVAGRAISGDPTDSTLYKEVSAGKMPPQPGQPLLAAEEIQAISDWITAGALNN